MSFETELVTKLKTISGLSSSVFPLSSPESVSAPYLVYHKIRGDDRKSLSGYNTGQSHDIFQLDIYHTTYKGMKTMASAVSAAMKALNGQTLTTILVQEITVSETVELYETAVYLYRAVIEIEVYY